MNLTFEVMLPPRGATDWTVSCNPTVRVLAPVAIYERKTVNVIGMRCTGYLHCPDVPEHPSWPLDWTLADKLRFMNSVLTKAWDEELFVGEETIVNSVEKRQWSGNANALNVPTRNALLTDRQVEVSWNTLRNVFRDNKRNAGFTADDFIYTLPA